MGGRVQQDVQYRRVGGVGDADADLAAARQAAKADRVPLPDFEMAEPLRGGRAPELIVLRKGENLAAALAPGARGSDGRAARKGQRIGKDVAPDLCLIGVCDMRDRRIRDCRRC